MAAALNHDDGGDLSTSLPHEFSLGSFTSNISTPHRSYAPHLRAASRSTAGSTTQAGSSYGGSKRTPAKEYPSLLHDTEENMAEGEAEDALKTPGPERKGRTRSGTLTAASKGSNLTLRDQEKVRPF